MAYSPIALVNKNIWDFDPRIIPGCVLWMDAADINTQFQNFQGTIPVSATGQNVALWKSKTVNIIEFANSTANPPRSAFSSQNGRSTISFTPTGNPPSSGQSFTSTTIPNLPITNQSGTYFIVSMSTTTYTLPQMLFSYGTNPTANNATRQFYYSSNTYPGALVTDIFIGSSRITDGTDYRNSYSILSNTMVATATGNNGWDNGNVFSGGNPTFPNGASLTSMAVGTSRATIGFGNSGTADSYWLNGNIAEILVFNNVLTTTERQQIEGYLAWKWGLQGNLATNHPYRNTYTVVRPFLRPFVPTDISKPCLLWFDGADERTLSFSSGTNVSAWSDKSGNANNITTFTTPLPTYTQSTRFLNFTGGTGTTINNTTFTNNLSYTIFHVVKFPTLTNSGAGVFFRAFQQAGGTYFFGINRLSYSAPGISNVGYYTEANVGNGPFNTFTTGQGFNTYAGVIFVSSITQDSTPTYTLSVNGNLGSSSQPSVTVTNATISGSNTVYNVSATASFRVGGSVIVSGITLGSGASGYNGIGVVQSIVTNTSFTLNITSVGPASFSGATASSGTMQNKQAVIGTLNFSVPYEIGEVLLYDGGLSRQDRQRVEGYLMWKWGIQRTTNPGTNTNFPTSHPMYNFPSASVTPFSPFVISNLLMWYDGADTTSLVLSGSTVTTWNDKSTNGNHLTDAVGPTRTATTSNPAGWDISFNGTTQYIRSNALAVTNGTNIMSVFIVVKNNTSATLGRIIAGITNGPETTENGAFRFANAGTNSIAITKGSTTGTQDGTNYTISSDVYHIINIIWNGAANSPVYVDGSLNNTYSANSNTTFSFTRFGLGASLGTSPSFTPATFWSGSLNEVIIYKSALTLTERQQVEGYLAWKWGLNSSLPTSHAYYKVPFY